MTFGTYSIFWNFQLERVFLFRDVEFFRAQSIADGISQKLSVLHKSAPWERNILFDWNFYVIPREAGVLCDQNLSLKVDPFCLQYIHLKFVSEFNITPIYQFQRTTERNSFRFRLVPSRFFYVSNVSPIGTSVTNGPLVSFINIVSKTEIMWHYLSKPLTPKMIYHWFMHLLEVLASIKNLETIFYYYRLLEKEIFISHGQGVYTYSI